MFSGNDTLIACQFEIGYFVRHFEGKTQKSSECYFQLKKAADLKRELLEFKSVFSGHLYEGFFHFMIFKYQKRFVLGICTSFIAYLLVINVKFVAKCVTPHC